VSVIFFAASGMAAATLPIPEFLQEEPISESVFTPWGNLHGIRVRGELIAFEAGVRVVRADWSGFSAAVKYLQRPRYSRTGNKRTVASSIGGVSFRKGLTDTVPGEATLEVEVVVEGELESAGVFLCLDLPGGDLAGQRCRCSTRPTTQARRWPRHRVRRRGG